MTREEFKIGQDVKIYDEDEMEWVKGKVTDITPVSVTIKWQDMDDPVDHLQDEYPLIKPI
jgi:hypothetical protein